MMWLWILIVFPFLLMLFFWIYSEPLVGIYIILLSSSYNILSAGIKIPLVKIVGIMLFSVWVLRIIQKKISLDKLRTPHTYLFLILIVIAYLSSLVSLDVSTSIRAASRFIFLFFLYASLVTLITTHRQMRIIIWMMILAALVNMMAGLIKANVPWYELLQYRLGGLTFGPDFTALYIVTVLPLVFYMMYLEKPKIFKFILLLFFWLMIVFVVLSFSRGGFLGLILVGIMLAIRFLHSPFYLGILIVTAIVGFLLAPVNYKDRMMTILYLPNKNLRVIDGSLDNRFNYLSIGIKKLFKSPVLGIGLDNFRKTIPLTETYTQQFLHNSYLEMGVEIGLFGLGVFLMLIWETLRYYQTARTAFKRARNYTFMYFAEAFFISFVAFAFGSMFLSSQFEKTFWILMAFSVFLYQMGYSEMVRFKQSHLLAKKFK